ncbi:PLP-dependent aminotransferase family protein [Streptomyces sp. CA-253872]|uniref:aminotransferase-like domain-containing protein n=1 Tax=Streptomyces sp. CA-253872 TaxID=3240067 RepID=UPI003D8E4F67
MSATPPEPPADPEGSGGVPEGPAGHGPPATPGGRAGAGTVSRLLGDWRSEGVAVHVALRDALAELIDGAYLPAGQRMPGQRELAAALGVARGTVVRAYAELTEAGRLVARHGSGTYVRGTAAAAGRAGEGRLRSFDDRPVVADLSSGALPRSPLVADVMPDVGRLLAEGSPDDTGYHPAGLPALRSALADRFTARGLPTREDQILVTAGSQQAVWLVATALTGPGTLALVEDPSYRGALEALAGAGARVRGVPFGPSGLDLGLLEAAAPGARLLYVQSALHNPTGVHTSGERRQELAALADRHGLLLVDDQSQAELGWFRSEPLHGLERYADPERLLVLGTLSKLFWGGLRIGWVRGPRELVGRLAELRRGIDLGGPVAEQLAALVLLPHAARERERRRAFLATQYEETAALLHRLLPAWTWHTPAGGSGLWADTGGDAVALARRALARGIRLTPGPAFSPHGGHRGHVRLPVWQEGSRFAEAAGILAEWEGEK